MTSTTAASLMSEYVPAPPQSSQPAPTSRLDVIKASHHMPTRTGTFPWRQLRPWSGPNDGSLPRQISSAICFGQNSETIGTNHAPIAHGALWRNPSIPTAGRLRTRGGTSG